MPAVETSTPPNTPEPIGPYNHIAKVGSFIFIGATAGVDPATGQLSGPDIESQTRQTFDSFKVMLESVGSDLAHVVHVTVFLSQMNDFDAMNTAYVEKMGNHRPARTVIGVREATQAGRTAHRQPHGRHVRVEPTLSDPAQGHSRTLAQAGDDTFPAILAERANIALAQGTFPTTGAGERLVARLIRFVTRSRRPGVLK